MGGGQALETAACRCDPLRRHGPAQRGQKCEPVATRRCTVRQLVEPGEIIQSEYLIEPGQSAPRKPAGVLDVIGFPGESVCLDQTALVHYRSGVNRPHHLRRAQYTDQAAGTDGTCPQRRREIIAGPHRHRNARGQTGEPAAVDAQLTGDVSGVG